MNINIQKIKLLINENISLLKDNDEKSRNLRENGIDVSKQRSYLHEIKKFIDSFKNVDFNTLELVQIKSIKSKLELYIENNRNIYENLKQLHTQQNLNYNLNIIPDSSKSVAIIKKNNIIKNIVERDNSPINRRNSSNNSSFILKKDDHSLSRASSPFHKENEIKRRMMIRIEKTNNSIKLLKQKLKSDQLNQLNFYFDKYANSFNEINRIKNFKIKSQIDKSLIFYSNEKGKSFDILNQIQISEKITKAFLNKEVY